MPRISPAVPALLLTALAMLGPLACGPASPPALPPAAPSSQPGFGVAVEPLPELAVLRFGSSAFRHAGSIDQIVFAGNGKSLATGADDGTAKVWDLAGRLLASTSFGASNLTRVGLSFDGRWLAAQGGGDARVVDVASGRTLSTLGDHLQIEAFQFSPGGTKLAGSAPGRILVWSTATWQILHETALPEGTSSMLLRFTDDSHLMAARANEGEGDYALFDVLDGAVLHRADPALASRRGPGALDPERLRVAACDAQHRVIIQAMATGKEEAVLPAPIDGEGGATPRPALTAERAADQPPPCTALAFSPDGRFLVTSSPITGLLKRPLDGAAPLRLSGPTFDALLAISPDASLVAFSSAGAPLTLYRASDGAERPRPGHPQAIFTGELRADGEELVTVSQDQTAILWSTKSGAELRRWKQEGPLSRASTGVSGRAAVSFEGRRIVFSAPRDRWDLEDEIRSIAPGNDGARLFAALASGGVEILDPAARRTVADIAPPGDPPTDTLVVSPNGKVLALGRSDGRLALHRTGDGSLIRRLAGHEGHIPWLAFSPDGTRLYSAGADAVPLAWDLRSLPEAMLPAPPAPGPPTVDPALQTRLDGERLTGLVRPRLPVKLAATAAAARALAPTGDAVLGDAYLPALTVVADEGDVVRVSTALAARSTFTPLDPDYAIEAYLRRADLAPLLRASRRSEAADGTGFVLREGLLLDLVSGVRPLGDGLATLPLGLTASDVSLSFQAAPRGPALGPTGKPFACDGAPCHFVAAPAHRRAPALPPLRLLGEPAGAPHAFLRDDCSQGVDVHSSSDGSTLLLTKQLTRAVVRVAVERAVLTPVSPCRGGSSGLASLGGNHGSKKVVVWQVSGRVPAFFPDGSKAGYHTGAATELRDASEHGALICARRTAFVDLVCHERRMLKQVTVDR
jgi:WD40 repeat protein